MKLSSAQYEAFRAFLERACGIVLGENKQYLVNSRIARLMVEHQVSDVDELIRRMERFSERRLKETVIDAMTTNETLWFRDAYPFDVLKNQLLPELMDGGSGAVRIWSAACSSGQEPYSISMTVEEYRSSHFGGNRRAVDIVATDLSSRMLDVCRRAEYNEMALARGLSEEKRQRFFDPLDDGVWRVKKEISERVKVQSLNLQDSFITLGKFDVIFCRNVLIYFSPALKKDILQRLHAVLRPGGYLFLGASEGLSGCSDMYDMVHCQPGIVYRAR